jgi:hypothetical protein
MTTATVAPSPLDKKILTKRIALCEELVSIHKKHESVFARMDEIKSELKAIATSTSANFKETIAGKGTVTVAGEKDGAFKGDFPIVRIEAWKGLKPKQQDDLLEKGIIAIEAQYSGKYYGAVTVKLF